MSSANMKLLIERHPLPWHTDLNVEAGLIFDAVNAVVCVVDQWGDEPDGDVHAFASAVAEAVNGFSQVATGPVPRGATFHAADEADAASARRERFIASHLAEGQGVSASRNTD